MSRQEIIDYLKQLKQQGHDLSDGISQLKSAGWTEEQINEAKKVVYPEESVHEQPSFSENISNQKTGQLPDEGHQFIGNKKSNMLSGGATDSHIDSIRVNKNLHRSPLLVYGIIVSVIFGLVIIIASVYFLLREDSENTPQSDIAEPKPSQPVTTSRYETTELHVPEAMCYLSNIKVNDDLNVITRQGIRIEVICAHATLPIVGYDGEASQVSLMDGEDDLIQAGKDFVQRFQEENPGSMFFSTEILNDLDKRVDNRVLVINAHTNVMPESGVAQLTGTLVLNIQSDERMVFETTVADIKNQSDIDLNGESSINISSTNIGFIGSKPIYALRGNVGFDKVVNPPSGVQNGEIFNRQGIIIDDSVPPETQLSIQIRKGAPFTLSLYLPINVSD